MSDASTSLFVVLRGVLFDEAEQSAYRVDPSGYLAAHGYDELDHDDVSEAMTLLADTLPADQAVLLSSAGDAGGFGGAPAAPAPPSDLAPVDQAVHTINHYVDTVREAPDAGLGGADPGPGDLALLDAAAVGDVAGDPTVGFDDLSDGAATGALDGVDVFDGLDGAPAHELDGDLDDQLAAFAAPDVLVHGDPVDVLLEDGDLAAAFDAGLAGAVDDTAAFDLGDDAAAATATAATFDADGLDEDTGFDAEGVDDLDDL